MPRCLDNPVGLSEFTIDSHTIGKLLAELIGPDVVIYKGPLELAQDLEAEILEYALACLLLRRIVWLSRRTPFILLVILP